MKDIIFTYNKYENNEIENTALNIREVGHDSYYGQKSWGPGNKDFYVIHYIIKGKGMFKCNNNNYKLKEKDVFLIRPKDDVFYTPDKYDPWEYFWVSFDGSLVNHFLAHMPFTKEKPFFHSNEDLKAYFKSIMDYEGADAKSKTYMLGYLYIFFAALMNNNQTVLETKNYFQISYEYILKNFADKELTVSSVSNMLNITRGHLYKIFKERINMSPVKFITKCRMEESLLLLRSTDKTITQISSEVGFKDPYYFSNVFKKEIGVSPDNYRKTKKVYFFKN